MKVFLSVFKDEKCASCNTAFQIISKRRQCKQCKKLFCGGCSVKIRDTKKLIGHKRFCLQCNSVLNAKPNSVTVVFDRKPDLIDPAEENKSTVKTQALPPKQPVIDPKPLNQKAPEEKKKNIVQGVSKRLSGSFKQGENSQIILEDPSRYFIVDEELYNSENFTVYSVRSLSTNFIYSMKKIKPRDNEERLNISSEANLHLKTSHPNLISYHSVYSYDYSYHIVLEKHEGVLYNILNAHAGFISEKHMSYICKEVLKGLDFLHSSGRIHRDIKSQNIVLFRNGAVKLGDFGYAAQVADEIISSKVNPSWMAPELILGREYNESVDLWSLGILLLEMAEGVPPYNGESYDVVMHNIISNPAPRLRNKLKWSKDMANFLSLCVRKEPIERLNAKSLLMHPFIEENDEETSKDQFAEYYLQVKDNN